MRKTYLVLLFITSLNLNALETIHVVVNNAPPYRIIKDDNYSGIYIEIIQEIAKDLNLQIQFQEVPFTRALLMMKTGEADIMLGPNKTLDREEYIYFIEDYPLPRENKIFYVSDPQKIIYTYMDLYDKSIEVLRGAVYFDKFDSDSNLTKYEISDYQQAILKVKRERSDVVIMPELQGDYLLKELNIKLIKSPFIIEGKDSFIGISKNISNFNSLKDILIHGLKIAHEKRIDETIIKKYTQR
ncbi:MAG: transporter substrate-binding domain-containing protein [Spirochaetales bacterium]|nr:transporter substrate-binding domain-containing protein [Spirochaetales bacterium]